RRRPHPRYPPPNQTTTVCTAHRLASSATSKRAPSHRQPPPARAAPARLPSRAVRQACGAAHAAPPRLGARAGRLHRRRCARPVPAQRPSAVRPAGAARARQALLRPPGHHLLPLGQPALARRACLSELLGAPRVRGFRHAREAEAAALIAAVRDASRAGCPVNLSERLLSTSNRVVMRVAFGDHGGEGSAAAVVVLEEAQKHFGAFYVSDYVPWLGWLDALRGLPRRLERYFHELDAFYERLIHDHLNKAKAADSDSMEDDLVDVLLRLHGDPAHRATFGSRDATKGILMDIFIAGTDTTAATLEWTMTELIRHPDILSKAQHEVRSIMEGSGDDNDRDMVRETDLPRLRYLKQVIRESMRLHPPAPLLVPRETTEACTVRGYEIPARTRVIVNAAAIGRDPDAWGPDAARFVPERHEGEGVDLSDHKPWHDSFALVPFGMGRRSCPAVHFATAVVELLLANLLFCFDWPAPRGEVDVEEKQGLIVSRKNPLVLVAEGRRCV
ncbi:hypothetical protein BS78_06G136000, partial [Paspalum vaginatum]